MQFLPQFSPGDFAAALQRVLESKQSKRSQQHRRHHHDGDAGESITLRVRPAKRPGRAKRVHGMYSPMTKEEADQVRKCRSIVWRIYEVAAVLAIN